MKSSTRDIAEGKMHQAKGSIKKAIGRLICDCGLKAEGKSEYASGQVQEKVGEVKKVIDY